MLDVHDLMPELMEIRFHNTSVTDLLKIEEKISANFCNTILSVNDLHEDRFKRMGIRRKVIPILNVSEKREGNICVKDYSSDKVKIVYAATITKNVGIETLIYSMIELKKKTNNFQLFIYGDGPSLQENIQLMNTLNLSDCITFSKKWLPFNELFDEYNSAHIGVVPTSKNKLTDLCLGAKISEYFSKKIAVVMSDTRSNKHYYSDCSLLFKAGDSIDLANKLYDLIQNEELMKDYAEKGYLFYQKNSWEKYEQKYIDVLHDLS